jgi:hypothetical protein
MTYFELVGGRLLGARASVWYLASMLALGALATGCHGGDDDDAAPHCGAPAGARGTSECQRWQVAICDYAEKCGTLAQCTCITQASSLACKSEAEATRCADLLPSAACGDSALASCDLAEMADPAPAVAGCQQFLSAYCDLEVSCGISATKDACLTSNMGSGADQVDCTRVIGLSTTFDQCLADIPGVSCQASSAPASCKNVLLAAQ